MGTWGYGPFDNDSAGDMAAGLSHKVRKVVDGRREYGYYEARAAAQFLLLSHGTDILGGPGLDDVVQLLAMMRTDAEFLASCREPKQMAAELDKELLAALARMRACKGCRRMYNMKEHKAEWKELEALVQQAREAPVPKSTMPPRRHRFFSKRLKKRSKGGAAKSRRKRPATRKRS